MKAKQIKHILVKLNTDKYLIFQEDETGFRKQIFHKLSLKNCQAIERGYDLDELAYKITNEEHLLSTQYSKGYEKGIVIGFQKALEILGDKRFSEDDVREAIEIARNGSMQEQHNGYGRPTELRFVLDNISSDEIIQSLQQNEWEVEIEMEEVAIGDKYTPEPKPKLDADGCLILKRVI